MARLHEYQGKEILKGNGINVPVGQMVRFADDAADVARAIGGRVVLKAQAWVTGRATKGGVIFADTPDEAAAAATELLALKFGNFPVTEVLVEQAINITNELFVSFTIDDAEQAPMLLLDVKGGSGIEDRASTVARIPIDIEHGVDVARLKAELEGSAIDGALHERIMSSIQRAFEIARDSDARSLEINPLVITDDERIIAADCRMTIDDYAVFRHPDFGIEIARELDHPATQLERIAYAVEEEDHRGTFYFAQLNTLDDLSSLSERGARGEGSLGLIGFHGAGGGGSMMSMDAVSNAGFTLANFCDTSGNPSAAKVYRAARIILSQPGIIGYFGSGSGVASQEQFWSAYGLAKAFREVNLNIPAVIRLGGNSEDRAVEVLEDACRNLPANVEGYKKDDTPAFCAQRFAELVEQAGGTGVSPVNNRRRSLPPFIGAKSAYSFPIRGGTVWIDHASIDDAASMFICDNSFDLLTYRNHGRPELAVPADEIANKDSECIAMEIECARAELPYVFVALDIPGLDGA